MFVAVTEQTERMPVGYATGENRCNSDTELILFLIIYVIQSTTLLQ